MATLAADKVSQQLNSSIRLPKDRYTIRCVEETVSDSKSSGNPMITAEFEIAAPESISINGVETVIAGTKVNPKYYTIKNLQDAAKDAKNKTSLLDYYRRIGATVEIVDGLYHVNGQPFDDDSVPLLAKGKLFDAILRSEEYPQLKAPTAEQKAKNQPGDPIKGSDGKPLPPKFSVALAELLGPSNGEGVGQF